MNKYGLFVLPVVDSGGILVGLVTGDDMLELATEEETEDFHKGAPSLLCEWDPGSHYRTAL